MSFHPEGPENARAVGLSGQYNVMPELSLSVPYNPFKVDIFQAAWTVLMLFRVGLSSRIETCTEIETGLRRSR